MSSEIFDEYAKLAIEQGLIKNAAEETNPRYDTQDLSAIQLLYGVNPNKEKTDILDQAHPESVVVTQSYDRLNCLVENLKERQNVMVEIARKPTDAKLSQRRYVTANQDLVNHLIRVSFLLDKKNETDLMKLADNCSERLIKTAPGAAVIVPFILPAIAIAATVFFFVSYNHSAVVSVNQNAKNALQQILELPGWPEREDISDLHLLVSMLEKIIEASDLVKNIKISGSPEDPRTMEELNLENKEDLEKAQEHTEKVANHIRQLYNKNAVEIIEYYKKVCKLVQRMIPKYIDLLKLKEEQNKGSHWSMTSYFLKGYRWLIQSDYEDVEDELDALNEAINDNMVLLESQKNLLRQFADEKDTAEKLSKTMDYISEQRQKLDSIPGSSESTEDNIPSPKTEEEQLNELKLPEQG